MGMEDNLCSAWLLQQRLLGTTFPPLTTSLPGVAVKIASSRCRCQSEPSLLQELEWGEEQEGEDQDDEDQDDEEEDEDYLFEFDIGSPVSSEMGDINEVEQNTIVNILEEQHGGQTLLKKTRSSSCSSSGSSRFSQRRVDLDETLEDVRFGSVSDGLGLQLRPSMEQEEAGGTLILPSPAPASPLVSPDSCLEEELEEQVCRDCGLHSPHQEHERKNVNLIEEEEDRNRDNFQPVFDKSSCSPSEDTEEPPNHSILSEEATPAPPPPATLPPGGVTCNITTIYLLCSANTFLEQAS